MGSLQLPCSHTLLLTPTEVTLNGDTAAQGLCLLSAAESLQKRRISVGIKSECPNKEIFPCSLVLHPPETWSELLHWRVFPECPVMNPRLRFSTEEPNKHQMIISV